MPLAELVVDVQYAYPTGEALSVAWTLPLNPSHVTVLFGPSGSGKSTFLELLAGTMRPDSGFIRHDATVWFDKTVFLPPQKRGVGLLFQDYPLFPHLTVAENIAYGLRFFERRKREEAVRYWIEQFQLSGKEDCYPTVLSGGERQRIALAQALALALAKRPPFLLLDEPFSALDDVTRNLIRGRIQRWLKEHGIPTLLVSHDISDALILGNNLAVMSEGAILQKGDPFDVLRRPDSARVAKIIGVENLLSGRTVHLSGEMVTLEIGSLRLVGIGSAIVGERCFASIRAEEVILQKGVFAQSSARNHFLGRVRQLVSLGARVKVTVDCGIVLDAMVTSQAVEELSLSVGQEITAVIKASCVHIIGSV